MISGTKSGSRAFATLSAWLLIIAFGCGEDDGIGRRYSVSGTVTYNGKPVEKGSISFIPEKLEEGRIASGTIVGGSYSLTTLANEDGALPGPYKVIVISKLVDISILESSKKPAGGRNPYAITKANKAAKDLVPTKYGAHTTTDLTAVVKEQSNTIDFPLKD